MITRQAKPKRTIMVRLSNGEDILASLREAVKRENISNAVILSGFGSVKSYHFHVVATGDLPPKDVFIKGDKALDVVHINGAIIDGRVHAHITLTDDKTGLGGHVEPGCTVLTFIIITIQEIEIDSMAEWDSFAIMN